MIFKHSGFCHIFYACSLFFVLMYHLLKAINTGSYKAWAKRSSKIQLASLEYLVITYCFSIERVWNHYYKSIRPNPEPKFGLNWSSANTKNSVITSTPTLISFGAKIQINIIGSVKIIQKLILMDKILKRDLVQRLGDISPNCCANS